MATLKQQKLARLISEYLLKRKASKISDMKLGNLMKQCGYSDSMCKKPAEALKGKAFIELLESAGATDEKLAEVISGGLNAERVEVVKYEGNITDEKSYPDYGTRKGYVDILLELKGHKNNDIKIETNGTGVVNIYIPAKKVE